VLFPMDDEIPEDTQAQIATLKKRSDAAYEALPGYVKKLVSGYRMHNFGFEIFECARKLALVCMPVFFDPPGSASQLIFGLMVCFITFGAYTAVNPFEEDRPNIFAQLCQFQIFFALLSSIALKFSSTMTPDALRNMDGLLTILTFVPLTVSVILRTPLNKFLEQRERDQLNRKLMRLCYKADSALVDPVDPPPMAAPEMAAPQSMPPPAAKASDDSADPVDEKAKAAMSIQALQRGRSSRALTDKERGEMAVVAPLPPLPAPTAAPPSADSWRSGSILGTLFSPSPSESGFSAAAPSVSGPAVANAPPLKGIDEKLAA